jgi:hypothetical protein
MAVEGIAGSTHDARLRLPSQSATAASTGSRLKPAPP